MIAKVENLKKAYQQHLVLDGISFQIQKGEIVCLLGPSGSGKTSLLNIIAGLQKADEGLCQVFGQLSYVFQEDRLLPWKNVLENVVFPDEKPDYQRAREILQKMALLNFCEYYPEQLSGGMKQRVSIARAFYAGHQLLLMDEPFQSLDVELRLKMVKELIALWEVNGNSILFVTHSIEEALLLGHQILVLSGLPSKVKKVYKVQKAPSERLLEDYKELKKEIETLFIKEDNVAMRRKNEN